VAAIATVITLPGERLVGVDDPPQPIARIAGVPTSLLDAAATTLTAATRWLLDRRSRYSVTSGDLRVLMDQPTNQHPRLTFWHPHDGADPAPGMIGSLCMRAPMVTISGPGGG
jgi:hypothetical protein